MFPSIDDVTKDMLRDSGELQRAYLVMLAFNEAYDAYAEKHKDNVVPEELHISAETAAYMICNLVFGQKS